MIFWVFAWPQRNPDTHNFHIAVYMMNISASVLDYGFRFALMLVTNGRNFQIWEKWDQCGCDVVSQRWLICLVWSRRPCQILNMPSPLTDVRLPPPPPGTTPEQLVDIRSHDRWDSVAICLTVVIVYVLELLMCCTLTACLFCGYVIWPRPRLHRKLAEVML